MSAILHSQIVKSPYLNETSSDTDEIGTQKSTFGTR